MVVWLNEFGISQFQEWPTLLSDIGPAGSSMSIFLFWMKAVRNIGFVHVRVNVSRFVETPAETNKLTFCL